MRRKRKYPYGKTDKKRQCPQGREQNEQDENELADGLCNKQDRTNGTVVPIALVMRFRVDEKGREDRHKTYEQ